MIYQAQMWILEKKLLKYRQNQQLEKVHRLPPARNKINLSKIKKKQLKKL
jgi:hypothetical protein